MGTTRTRTRTRRRTLRGRATVRATSRGEGSFGSHLASMDQIARNPGAPGTDSPPLAAVTTRVNLDGSLRGGGSAGRDAPRRARRRARAGGAAAKGEALMATMIRTKPGGAAGASGRGALVGMSAESTTRFPRESPRGALLGPKFGRNSCSAAVTGCLPWARTASAAILPRGPSPWTTRPPTNRGRYRRKPRRLRPAPRAIPTARPSL